MDKPTALILGINSFLGRAIYELIKNKYEITGVYHHNKQNVPADVDYIQYENLSSLKEIRFEHVYIVAAHIPISEAYEDERLIEANLLLPKKVCEFFPFSRMIFCSSVSVYENFFTTDKISITSPAMPSSKYALSKLWAEKIVEKHASYAILRISSMYGAGMKKVSFVPKIIESSLSTGKITLWGNGERKQNYIHVNDVAQIAVKAASVSENIKVLAVNPFSYSNKSIAEIIAKNSSTDIEFKGEDLSPSFVYDNVGNAQKLGKRNYINIEIGIKELIEWMKK